MGNSSVHPHFPTGYLPPVATGDEYAYPRGTRHSFHIKCRRRLIGPSTPDGTVYCVSAGSLGNHSVFAEGRIVFSRVTKNLSQIRIIPPRKPGMPSIYEPS